MTNLPQIMERMRLFGAGAPERHWSWKRAQNTRRIAAEKARIEVEREARINGLEKTLALELELARELLEGQNG